MGAALRFERYGEPGRESGVTRYALTGDAIHVQFQDDRVYVYDAVKPGMEDVREMKRRALEGRGLSTYISQRVRQRYARWYVLTDPSS